MLYVGYLIFVIKIVIIYKIIEHRGMRATR